MESDRTLARLKLGTRHLLKTWNGVGMKKLGWGAAGVLFASISVASTDLQSCASIADSQKRLACFDSLAAVANPAPSTWGSPPPRPPGAPASAPTKATKPADSFGLSPKPATTEIRSRVNGLLDSWDADTVFQLANGQHWRVADGTSAFINLQDPEVVIKASALGGFRMEIAGSNRVVRVRRIR